MNGGPFESLFDSSSSTPPDSTVVVPPHRVRAPLFGPVQLVSCGVSGYQHTSVSLEFFETVVRYEKFFLVEPHHIPLVLVSGSTFKGV